MKARRVLGVLMLFLVLAIPGAAAQPATAPLFPNYGLDWFAVAGGGATLTSASYSVSGTVGQADAGGLTGPVYTLTGGFWSGALTPGWIYLPLIQR
jgi:hypothetical protein